MSLERALLDAEDAINGLEHLVSYLSECTDKTVSKRFFNEFLQDVESNVNLLREYADELKE